MHCSQPLDVSRRNMLMKFCEQFYSSTGRNCPLFSERSGNKEKGDAEVRIGADAPMGGTLALP